MLPDVVIPARNEALTIGPIVKAFFNRPCHIAKLIVVDNLSTDDTGAIAKSEGAQVVRCNIPGKGEAITAGLEHVTSDRVIFVDADLINFETRHVELLAADRSGMVIWTVDDDYEPKWANLTRYNAGTRSLPTALARCAYLEGYEMENMLNLAAGLHRVPIVFKKLPGVCQYWMPIVQKTSLPARCIRRTVQGACGASDYGGYTYKSLSRT
jgi:glycosyltransferase involved in cell wall biosynthesis